MYGFVGNDPINSWDYLGREDKNKITAKSLSKNVQWSYEVQYLFVPKSSFYVKFIHRLYHSIDLSGSAPYRWNTDSIQKKICNNLYEAIYLTIYAKSNDDYKSAFDSNDKIIYEPQIGFTNEKSDSPSWEKTWSRQPKMVYTGSTVLTTGKRLDMISYKLSILTPPFKIYVHRKIVKYAPYRNNAEIELNDEYILPVLEFTLTDEIGGVNESK